MREPKRFLTRLPPVPEPRHNQLCGSSFTNPREFLEDVRTPERHGETRGTECGNPVVRLGRGEER
eukprot:2162473-Pyramimonas_sp.AAC.1